MANRCASALATGAPVNATQGIVTQIRTRLGAEAPVFVAVFASTQQPLSEVMPRLRAEWPNAVIVGASTAGEFTQTRDAKGSIAAFALAGDFKVRASMARGLSTQLEDTIQAAVSDLSGSLSGYRYRTALMLIDPLAGNAEEATLIAATLLGENIRLAGGAAGDDLAMKSTTVALGRTIASDAIVIAEIFSNQPIGVGVCHGHMPLSKPLEVTRAHGSVVYEIEGQRAWDVWKRETARAATALGIDPGQLADDAITSFLLRFEAGLPTAAGYKIRAPLSRGNDGSLSFACGIPQGAKIAITESVPQRQIESARQAARLARAQLGSAPMAGAIVFDCICRKLILGDEFVDGVRGIAEELGNVPLAGFETYGEIAFDVGDMSGFHNTTTVVMAFPA